MEPGQASPSPENFPPPQVMVGAARDVGPVIEPVAAASAEQVIDADFIEVGGPVEEMPSIGGALRAFRDKALVPALEKLPQGASEIANSLFTPSAYWPGGMTQEPVPMGEGGIHGPAEAEVAVEPVQADVNGFQVFGPEVVDPDFDDFDEFNASLAMAANRGMAIEHNHDHGMDH